MVANNAALYLQNSERRCHINLTEYEQCRISFVPILTATATT